MIIVFYLAFRGILYSIATVGVPKRKNPSFSELMHLRNEQVKVHISFINSLILSADIKDMDKLKEYGAKLDEIKHKQKLYGELEKIVDEIVKVDPAFNPQN